MKEINVSLKIEEINLVLSALGNLPFIQVHELIGKIQGQASAQLAPPANGESRKKQTPEPERILEPEHN